MTTLVCPECGHEKGRQRRQSRLARWLRLTPVVVCDERDWGFNWSGWPGLCDCRSPFHA